ncbi:phage tail terminator family protein [Anaerotignum sp. MB30-C6]|uniref:phage tail terminator family protein n=1 Tax=Anaerotignum sp. MB30-C6 TaxID=3070814 RepID=UPI0027DD5C39|nr:hypothetical protein [Anaerotignum sp. MB30-C6]WMI82025.1 hypothetical protein RBQ60_04650 [Anaerotignum sp. MB30-C6]
MINNLITGITQAIRREFPEPYFGIYTEKTDQLMQKPCFFILCVNLSHKAKLGNRFIFKSSFDVQYFSEVGNNECWEVAEKLRGLLEEIGVDGHLVQGSSINYRVESGMLHFLIDYNVPMVHGNNAVEFMERVKVFGKTSKTGK